MSKLAVSGPPTPKPKRELLESIRIGETTNLGIRQKCKFYKQQSPGHPEGIDWLITQGEKVVFNDTDEKKALAFWNTLKQQVVK